MEKGGASTCGRPELAARIQQNSTGFTETSHRKDINFMSKKHPKANGLPQRNNKIDTK